MANKYSYIAYIEGDTSGIVKAMKDVEEQSKDLTRRMRIINEGLKFNPESVELLGSKFDTLSEQVKNAKVKLEALQSVEEQAKHSRETGATTKDQYAKYIRELTKAENNYKMLEIAAGTAKTQLDNVKEALKQTAFATEGLGGKLSEIDTISKSFDSELKEIDSSLRNNGGTEILEQKYTVLSQAIENTQKKLDALKSAEQNMNTGIESGSVSEEQQRAYQREIENTSNKLVRYQSELNSTKMAIDSVSAASETSANEQEAAFNEIEISLKNYNNALIINESELKKITAQYSDNANSVEALAAKQKLYEESISGQKQKIAVLNAALAESKKYYGESADETLKWQKAIVDAETSLIKAEKNLDSVNNSLKEQNSALDKAEDAVKDYDKSLDDANKTTVTFGDLVKANILGDVISNAFHRAADAVGDFIKQGIKLASDLTEVQNVVDVTFGDGAAQIYEWADAAAESFGMSSLAAQQFTGTIGAMLKSQGVANDSILEMSQNLAGLAGDIASFHNISVEQAFEKIRSGISGETEPLKQLGINMNVANLEAYMLAQGIDKTWKSMNVAEQTMIRYNYLMAQTADAQGDFARTSDSYANQQRILELQMQNLAASFGEKLLPMVNDLTGTLNENMPQIGDKIETVGNIVVGLFDFVIDHHEAILAVITGIGTALAAQKGAKAVGNITSAVKDLFNTVKSGQGVMSALAASLNTQPWVLAVGAIAAVTAGLVALASEAFKTSTALKEAAEASVQAYEDEKTKVAELETELDGVNKKIDEIQSKGKLSFTDAEELTNLQLQNGELSTQLALEKEILETKKRQAEYDLYNAVTNEDPAEEGTVAYIKNWISEYESHVRGIEGLKEEIDEALAKGNELRVEELREQMRQYEEQTTKEKLRIVENTASLNELAESLDLTTESGREAYAAVDDLVKKVSEMFNITESEKELISSDTTDFYSADSTLSKAGERYRLEGEAAWQAVQDEKAARDQSLKDFVTDLDERQNLRKISEQEYYDDLYGYLIEHEDRESVEWFKQLGRYEEYQQKQVDAAEKVDAERKDQEKRAAEEREKQEKESADERVKIIKGYWDKVTRLKERGEIDDEKEYKLKAQIVKKYCDENEDTWDDYYKWLYDYTKNKEDEIEELRLKNLEDSTKEQADRLQKVYEDIKSKKEQVKKDLQNIDLTETVKGKDGKDKLILNDLDAEIKKLDKYEASLAKLRATGISDSLIAEINKMSYADGSRQKYIDTLLSLSGDKLQLYYKDWNRLQARQESAANLEVEEELEKTNKEAEKALDSVTDMLSGMTKTAYEKGAETAQNFYQGIIDSMKDVNDMGTISSILDSVFSETSGKSGAAGGNSANGNGLKVGESYIAASTPIVINIDNKKYAEMTINDIIDKSARSGGNPLHL